MIDQYADTQGQVAQRSSAPTGPAPARILVSLATLALLVTFSTWGDYLDEGQGVLASCATAAAGWVFLWRFCLRSSVRPRLLWVISVCMILKVAANLGHFYYVFAPLAWIRDAASVADADFSGDLSALHQAALLFVSQRETGGVLHAVLGDYYRGINNPGVGVVYGVLYGAYGAYPTIAIPWATLAMGFSAAILDRLGCRVGLKPGESGFAAIALMLMPTFFVACPLYRDQFMVSLIVIIVYACLDVLRNGSMLSVASLAVAAVSLSTLRWAYIALAPIFLIIWFMTTKRRLTVRSRLALLGVGVLSVVVLPSLLGMSVDLPLARGEAQGPYLGFAATVFGDSAVGQVLGRVVFMLLTPMPWWQRAEAATLAYQVFDYGQTVLSITVLFAAGLFLRERGYWRDDALPLALSGLAVFSLAMAGTDLHQRYAQVGLPLIIAAVAPVLVENWRKCLTASVSIIGLTHLVLLIR